VGFPCEVALAAASMITGGTLARHPGLRMAFSHGGGAFALVLARMEHTWHKVAQMKEILAEPPSVYARRLYYDTAVFRPEALRFLVETFGEDRMLIGTDYPFGSHETDPLGLLRRTGLRDGALSAIGTDNAKRFLALQA
jgi:aminocarboxymuconate-semialdehyde decarboxylase